MEQSRRQADPPFTFPHLKTRHDQTLRNPRYSFYLSPLGTLVTQLGGSLREEQKKILESSKSLICRIEMWMVVFEKSLRIDSYAAKWYKGFRFYFFLLTVGSIVKYKKKSTYQLQDFRPNQKKNHFVDLQKFRNFKTIRFWDKRLKANRFLIFCF